MITFIQEHLWLVGLGIVVLLPVVKVVTGIIGPPPAKFVRPASIWKPNRRLPPLQSARSPDGRP